MKLIYKSKESKELYNFCLKFYYKIIDCIDSSSTQEHFMVCNNMINNFYKKLGFIIENRWLRFINNKDFYKLLVISEAILQSSISTLKEAVDEYNKTITPDEESTPNIFRVEGFVDKFNNES